MQDWQRFVIEHGFRANARSLAHILGRDVQDIHRLRSTGACAPLAKAKHFGELFALHHGREPEDSEWPAPEVSGGGGYEWQSRELALLATLVGTTGPAGIAEILTARLKALTGDKHAERSKESVKLAMNRIGLQTTDLVGGITVREAGLEIGSIAAITHATQSGLIKTKRVGRLLMIPHEEWARWKASRVEIPDGFVQLSTLREPLGIKSDKLPEYARMGYVPTAVQCHPVGTGARTSKHGAWYISAGVAKKLLADRRAGLPMPWHGKPLADNLKASFRKWQERKHPAHCEICAGTWGSVGAPATFEDYCARYPALTHGQKRHLTMTWNPGMTASDVAAFVGVETRTVVAALDSGALKSVIIEGSRYVSKTAATVWKSRGAPDGSNKKSWASLETAAKTYLFTITELQGFIKDGALASKIGENGPMRGVVYVSKAQCAALRERIGFTPPEAARRAGITVERLHHLLRGLDWRGNGAIPMPTLQAVMKRLDSRPGLTLDEAAEAIGASLAWVQDRVADGTVKVKQASWDGRRVYLSDAMLDRLRSAWQSRNDGTTAHRRNDENWLLLGHAAMEAGVSATTITRWAEGKDPRMGHLKRIMGSNGWLYHREAVRACARLYWPTNRFQRAEPPAWLIEELDLQVAQ